MHGSGHQCCPGTDGTGLNGPERPEEQLRPLRALCSERGAEARRWKCGQSRTTPQAPQFLIVHLRG